MSDLPELDQSTVPAGLRWAWEPGGGQGWRVLDEDEERRPCRHGAGPGRKACGRPSVAKLNRGRWSVQRGTTSSWWHYCADHLYGRVLVDGVLYVRILHRVEG